MNVNTAQDQNKRALQLFATADALRERARTLGAAGQPLRLEQAFQMALGGS